MGLQRGLRQGHGQKPTTRSGQGMGDVVPLLGGSSGRSRSLGPLLLNCRGCCWRHFRTGRRTQDEMRRDRIIWSIRVRRARQGWLDCGEMVARLSCTEKTGSQ